MLDSISVQQAAVKWGFPNEGYRSSARKRELSELSDSADGLAMLEKSDYQLILLDVMMPGIDGFQTMEKIRKQSGVPILMLTSKNDSTSKIRGLRSGADDYLTKPFDMEELIARVLSLIRRYTRFNLREKPADGRYSSSKVKDGENK